MVREQSMELFKEKAVPSGYSSLKNGAVLEKSLKLDCFYKLFQNSVLALKKRQLDIFRSEQLFQNF